MMHRLTAGLLAAMLATSLFAQTDLAAESQRGKEFMAAGRFSDAVPVYEGLVKAMPGNPGLRLNLALALHFAGQDQRAIPEFEAVLKAQPSALPALMMLGASYMRTGQPAKAAPLLEKAMAQAPDDLEGRAMLADALLMLERYGAAVPQLKRLAAADPDNPRVWFGLGKCYEALAQQSFERLGKTALDSPWWLALSAEVRLKENRNTAAFALYRGVLERQPGFRGAHAGLAEVYRKTKHPDWAAVEDEKEKKIPPPSCATPTAECHIFKAKPELALTAALRGKSSADLYWQTRAADELARASFARLGKLPPSVESHQVMAEIHRNQGHHAEEIEEWKAAIALRPDDPRLQQELATAVYSSRDYAAAETMTRELLRRDPDLPELWFMLGDSLMNLQRVEDCLEPLQKAIALRPDYLAAHAVLGRALLQMGRSKEAIVSLEKAVSIDTDGSLHFQLSRACQSEGLTAKAAEALKTYQKLRQMNANGDLEIAAPSR